MSITEKTRKEDEKLREKLKHVDPTKLKKVIKVLTSAAQTQPETKPGKRANHKP